MAEAVAAEVATANSKKVNHPEIIGVIFFRIVLYMLGNENGTGLARHMYLKNWIYIPAKPWGLVQPCGVTLRRPEEISMLDLVSDPSDPFVRSVPDDVADRQEAALLHFHNASVLRRDVKNPELLRGVEDLELKALRMLPGGWAMLPPGPKRW